MTHLCDTPCPKCGALHNETRYGKFCSLVCLKRTEVERGHDVHKPSASVTRRTPNASPRDNRER